jgi:tetratricopeptide (TPR) repeat protein
MKRLITSAAVIAAIGLFSCLYPAPKVVAQGRERGLKVGAQPAEVSGGRDIQRWAVVIGISRYKNGDKNVNGVTVPNLINAADDAQKFYNFLRSPEGGDFRDVSEGGKMVLLKDEQATKSNVEQALNMLKQAKPEDYFIIYIAGHGANVPAPDPKTKITLEVPYFILHDFDAADVANTAIRMTDFRDLVSHLQAKKGLVISDTCHSAGVMLAGRGMFTATGANTRFIDEMKSIPVGGIGFLSAAGQLESAQEDNEYGGIFTYCLLEALRGNADVSPADGVVTFGEVYTYLLKAVPELTEKLSGLRQNPVYNTTTLEANRIPLAIVSYPQTGPCDDSRPCGTLVIRTPDIDGVNVAINGAALGVFDRRLERTVRLPVGTQSLTFAKGTLQRELKAGVEPGKSKVVEVNLSFSDGNEDSLVAAPSRFIDVFMGDERPPSGQAQKYFRDGVEQFNKQRFAEAIKLLEQAVRANSGAYANALVYIGRAQQSLRHHKLAVDSFTAALKLRPSDFETQALLAEAKFMAGDNLQEVITILKDVISRHPNFDFARVVYGDLLLLKFGQSRDGNMQLLKDAEQQLRSALSANPNSPPAYLILADVLTHMDSKGKRKEAVEMAKKALELFEKLGEKKVRLSTGLKSLSISHVIFGGARYENTAVLAEANYILGKAYTRVVDSETNSECETSALNVGEQGNYLDKGRIYLDRAADLASKANDRLRLGLVLYWSAENYLLKGNLKGTIKDAQQSLAIPEMREYDDTHLLLYEAYKGDQQFAKAAAQLQAYIDLVKPRASQQELARLTGELQQVKRLADANQQK